MRHTKNPLLAIAVVGVLALGGCSTASPEGGGATPPIPGLDLVEALGGQEQHDVLMSLYEQAVGAGQGTVTVYGPEAAAQTPALLEAWSRIFPDITLVGDQVTGGQATERFRAEATTGQGTGDVYVGGPAVIANNEDFFTDLDSLVDIGLSDEWVGPKGFRTVGLTPFAFVYNPDRVDESELPASWDDVLSPEWDGRLSIWDPSQAIGLDTIAAMMYADIWTEEDVYALAAQNATIVPLPDFLGVVTNVAQGQSDGGFWTSVPQINGAIADGAPVAAGFPLERDNMLSREMVGLLESAPNPLAATLYANWRLTPSGANALAGYGMYSLVPGADSPEGLPAFQQLDYLPVVPYDELMAQYQKTAPVIRQAFGL